MPGSPATGPQWPEKRLLIIVFCLGVFFYFVHAKICMEQLKYFFLA